MVNKSGRLGTAGETAVVRYLRVNGFPQCERRRLRGAEDWGDLTGTPGICWEVKAGEAARTALEAARGADVMLTRWLGETETERRNSGADLGLLVVQRRGAGDPGRWMVVLEAEALVRLILCGETHEGLCAPVHERPTSPVRLELQYVVRMLRAAGYGDPLPEPESVAS